MTVGARLCSARGRPIWATQRATLTAEIVGRVSDFDGGYHTPADHRVAPGRFVQLTVSLGLHACADPGLLRGGHRRPAQLHIAPGPETAPTAPRGSGHTWRVEIFRQFQHMTCTMARRASSKTVSPVSDGAAMSRSGAA